MRISAVLFLVGASIAQWGCSRSSQSVALDKPAFEAYLRHIELYRGAVEFKIDDPKPSPYFPGFSEVLVHLTAAGGTRDETYYVSADGQTFVKGDLYNLKKDPFQGNLDKLKLTDQPTFGPADAPVTIVEFADLQCPDCQIEAPLLRKNIPETYPGKVRVVFKDYPLESVHPWARAAAVAGRCIYHQDAQKFWAFYDWIYATQPQINVDNLRDTVLKWAGESGVDAAKLGSCMDSNATDAEVERSMVEARSLGVRGTPTMFINGRKIGGLAWPDLQLVIKLELDHKGVK